VVNILPPRESNYPPPASTLQKIFHGGSMKKIKIITCIYAGLMAIALASTALAVSGIPGSLDTTLNSSGKVTTDFLGGYDNASAMAVQSDGKIVVAGGVGQNAGRAAFGIARYNTNGSLDTTFDGDGKVIFRYSIIDDDIATAVAIQTDGKIVVAGTNFFTGSNDFIVVRFNVDGSIDTSFGFNNSGTMLIGETGKSWSCNAMAIQSDGKILLGGSSEDSSANRAKFAIVRLNSDGTLDNTFNNSGKATFDISSSCSTFGCLNNGAYALKIQRDNKILLAGRAWNTNRLAFGIARLNADGTLDTTFGSNGKVVTSISTGTGHDFAFAMDLQKDDKIVMAGSAAGNGMDFALVRFNTDGSLDNTFGTGGVVITSINSGDDSASSLIIGPDGTIVAAGYCTVGGNRDFALVSYNANGSLDTTFGPGGIVTTSIVAGNDQATAMVAQPGTSKILLAGYAHIGTQDDFALARYEFNFGPSNGVDRFRRVMPYNSGVISVFQSGLIYYSPDGRHLGGGGDTIRAYGGIQSVLAMIPYNGGVMTAFSGRGIYFSPNGQNLGGGGNSTRPYPTNQPISYAVTAMMPYNGGVITAFTDGPIYYSPDGLNPHGGGSTTQLYFGTQTVVAMSPYQNGVITAFSSNAIYYSPDGQNLGGGGNTIRSYPTTQSISYSVTAMMPYNGGVFTAFSNGPIYYSPDGNNLGGGGGTTQVYSGTQRVLSMIPYNGGVLTAFSGRSIYFSPNGQNLGGGPNITVVYPGPLMTVAMIPYNSGVITAFTNSAYFSPNGQNLGGGGSTTQVYP
jgi:uncharacterized delta-60 repeat protein